MQVIKKCCFCINLRTGGVALGIWTMIVSIMTLLVSIVAFTVITEHHVELMTKGHPEMKEVPYSSSLLSIQVFLAILIAITTLSIVASGLLIYGSVKVRRDKTGL